MWHIMNGDKVKQSGLKVVGSNIIQVGTGKLNHQKQLGCLLFFQYSIIAVMSASISP